jgi:proteasome component ECM29
VLPVSALLDQYKSTDSPLVKHFDLVFIQHSVGRLEPSDRRELISKAIRGIGSDSSPGTAALFHVLLRLLLDLRLPPRGSKEDDALREQVGLGDSLDAKFVAGWLGKLMLLRPGSARPEMSPGLTEADITFLTLSKPDTWNPASGGLSLPELRIKSATFLTSAAFTDDERFLPALYAAGHTDSRVSNLGEDMLKRSTVSLEDATLVKSLFEAHDKLTPPYRIRILGLLSRSEVATTFGKEILDVFRQNVAQPADIEESNRAGANPTGLGLEFSKTHRALFEFVNWVARIGSKKESFSEIGGPLINLLRDFIHSQGWPRPMKQSLDEIARRSQAYETIGVLARGVSMPTEDSLSLMGWLIRSLAEDPLPDVVVNIDGALSAFTASLKVSPDSSSIHQEILVSILLTYMTMDVEGHVVRSARHAVTKLANVVLPFSHIYARWIDILAVAGRRDERNEVTEEGLKGLDPWTYNRDNDRSRALPKWDQMVQKFFKEPITHANNRVWLAGRQMDVDELSVFVNFPGDTYFAFPVAVDYCKRILFLTALTDFTIEPGWERELEALIKSDKNTRSTIRKYLSSNETQRESLLTLLTAAFEGMVRENPMVVEQCARTFVELASLSPKAVLASLASRSRELLPLIKSNKKEIRTLGARAYGILAAHPANPAEAISTSRDELVTITKGMATAIGSELNAVEGAFVALAHLLSRQAYYSGKTSAELGQGLDQIFPSLDAVSTASISVQEALFETYAQIWTAGIPGFTVPSDEQSVVKSFLAPLSVQAKKGNERAITALGRLAVVASRVGSSEQDGDKVVGLVLEKLYELYEIKQAEIHFAVGEAITATVARWDSDVVQLTLDVESGDTSYYVSRSSTRLVEVLDKLLTDSKTTKPSLLKASGIWLFCIIQHCSQLEEVQTRLRECQVAFMRLLSARDDLVQETASRGLSLVYEKGDPSLKDDLVRDLVASFTGSGKQLKVDDDTELFEAGALPTGEGKSITSYKDIVNLANEVGDQSLVYKFMSLANNAATWSTRSAFGRFGLSNLLTESEVDPKLYPKLFRYRFDPNQNVQKSMNDIWKALVKDSNAVLDTHFDAIMIDLLKSILGKEWRVREASCAAISDLIQGQPFPKYEKFYEDIWAKALKVLDDVKATVRAEALKLCVTLSNTLVRQLEESSSPASATKMMNQALPFLLSDKGIESGVEDVKIFATITVMKITKTGGKALKPYIANMVAQLLGLLSTIEPDVVNYHYLRAGEDNREKIDKFRSALVSQSPISEAIENCLRNVDKDVMPDLAAALDATIKSAVGMPTKIGCSRVIGTLATRHSGDFEPYSARFLQLMEKQALDRNDEVSQGYARAAAYIVRVAPESAKVKFVEHFVELYLKSEGEGRRQKVADVVLALSKISPDHFGSLEGQLLPFAFLAKHDTDEYVQKEADEVWSKHAGSSLTVMRYVPEIVHLVQRSLDTAQWALKHAGALTTASLVGAVSNASDLSGQVNLNNLKAIWPVFDKSLALKTFPDKEKLLDAFPDFVKKAKALWTESQAFADQLKKIAVREAKRNNDPYRPHAFRCLWKFAAAREDLNMLEEIAEITASYLEEEEPTESAKDSDKTRRGGPSGALDLRGQTTWAAIEAIAKGYNRENMRNDPSAVLGEVITVLEKNGPKPQKGQEGKPWLAGSRFDMIRRLHWYSCFADIMDEASQSERSSAIPARVLEWFLGTLDLDKPESGTEDQRMTRTKAVVALVQFWKKQATIGGVSLSSGGHGAILTALRERIETAGRNERSLDVQEKWKTCFGLLTE